jgi:hypothetical protein
MVRQYGKTSLGLALVVVLVSTLGLVGTAPGQATTPQADSQVKPYVILSGEFFDAMAKLSQSGVTYGDRQEPLLEQIALASRYMVKTNLTLVQQNEKIIRLLEELNRKRNLEAR